MLKSILTFGIAAVGCSVAHAQQAKPLAPAVPVQTVPGQTAKPVQKTPVQGFRAQPAARPAVKADVAANGGLREPVSTRRPNTLSAELLGRGGLYSVNYDHSLGRFVSLGVGFSYWSLSTAATSTTVGSINISSPATSDTFTIIPVYTNIYFLSDRNRPYVSLGVDIVSTNSTSGSNSTLTAVSGSGTLPVIGAGYEFRGDGGFLFRGATYVLAGSKTQQITGGASFGATF